MKGIELVKDKRGKLTEIRVAVADNPELAADVRRLISIQNREEGSTQSQPQQASTPMTLKQFRLMVREAKQSGEISEAEFFQKHPEWQTKER